MKLRFWQRCQRGMVLACVMVSGVLGSQSVFAVETAEKTLKNGLKVIVRSDHRAPVVVSQLWYRVGSVDESETVTGVSHALEHMMFRGTARVPDGEFARRVSSLGGRHNAFTSRDFTVYFEQVAADKLPQVLQLEADRMGHLMIRDELFAREIQVVREERRLRTDDSPSAFLFEQLYANALQANPARYPIIGWAADIERMQAQHLRDWYRRWYQPGNATLVIVGAVEPAQVFRDVEKYFGGLKGRYTPAANVLPEPPQQGIRRFAVKRPSALPYLAMAWHVPRLTSTQMSSPEAQDVLALTMLASVLDGLSASRFPKVLVREKRLATSVGVQYDWSGRGAPLFTLMGVPAHGVTVAQLEQAFRDEIARIVREGVSDQELARLRVQIAADKIYEKDSLFGQAMSLGAFESVGLGWRIDEVLIPALEQITSADLQRVAARYLVDDTLTVGELIPLPMTQKTAEKRRSVMPQEGNRRVH